MMFRLIIACLVLAAMLVCPLPICGQDAGRRDGFAPRWESLSEYTCPEWFRDAKFGIYAHWGPYSAAAGTRNTDWYSRNMYIATHDNHKFHVATYGPVSEFGYKDLIPRFRGQHFNANQWVDLYMEAGARFAGPVAEHADGFAMWDSKVTPWNAKQMGPKQDIVGQLCRAVRRRGLKLVTSFHHQWKWGWYPTWDEQTDTSNPIYEALYGPRVPPTAWGTKLLNGRFDVMRPNPRPDAKFARQWLAKVNEVVARYHPDLLWFDNRMQILPESVRLEMVANFYNQARQRGQQVVLTYKQPDLQEGTATIDLERARMPDIYPDPWLTDSSISSSSWAYAADIKYYTADRLVDDLVDIVSKNGCLLLNVAPRPDGLIPEEQQERLRAVGRWLRLNGEAIYGTRPWQVFGEGPTKTQRGHLADLKFAGFGERDIRFTRSKDDRVLYAIFLGWPQARTPVTIRSITPERLGARQVRTVRMIGCEDDIQFEQRADGLQVTFPRERPCSSAYVFHIDLQ